MIDLKPIKDILKENFFIPSYQRGYRWTKQQICDLLNDIKEFEENGAKGIYCIQPLVVKKHREDESKNNTKAIEGKDHSSGESWEVIDGQQRITTINLILSYLRYPNKYSIEYETRKGSREFLEGITQRTQEESNKNIDFFYMFKAYQIIKAWFEENFGTNINPTIVDQSKIDSYNKILMDQVQFIWYETLEVNQIEVFTRLNIGKIALTDSELIKALFLNESNFNGNNEKQIRLQQQEIASEWDHIEFTLQKEEFWLFIHDTGYSKPTRIDFIFDLIREIKNTEYGCGDMGDCGTDEHQTFRYFYKYFTLARKEKQINAKWLRQTWMKVKNYFQLFEEWYNDLQLYHYIGYLVAIKADEKDMKKRQKSLQELIPDLIAEWHKSESNDEFLGNLSASRPLDKNPLKWRIIDTLKNCKDLDTVYSLNNKTNCKPLLLLHNVQTVINQNFELVHSDNYELAAFYKFPFHLYKKEGHKKNGKGWEVEHIVSNSGDIDDEKNIDLYLSSVKYISPSLTSDINNYFAQSKNKEDIFSNIKTKLIENGLETKWNDDDKNKIWNYTLLDSATNEEYQNSVFPIKRICIISKDQGRKMSISCNKEHKIIFHEENGIAFIPPCTKNVFTKYYTKIPSSLNSWTKDDAEAYKTNIANTLKEFLPTQGNPQNNQTNNQQNYV